MPTSTEKLTVEEILKAIDELIEEDRGRLNHEVESGEGQNCIKVGRPSI